MDQRRVKRARVAVSDFRPTGGVSATLSRRVRGRPETRKTASVVQYFGGDDDTPAMELLKAVRPEADLFRDDDNIHVSDIISRCVRRVALMRRLGLRHPQETVYDGRGVTFAIGKALHDYIKSRFTKGHPDKVWAKWTCICGETEFTGTYSTRPKKTCDGCGQPVDIHNEVPFVHQHYKLQGSPDLLLFLTDYDAFFVTELKSISANQWKELVRPIPDHVVQVALYWHILKACGYAVVDRVSVLYVNKEFSFKSPYKEYMIDPAAVDLSAYWEDLEALKAADEGGPLPPRIMCGTNDAPEAKKCPVCVSCFGCST